MTNLYNDGAPNFAGGPAKNTLTAFFDSRSDAETAIDKLKSAGVADVRLMPGYEADGEGSAAAAEGSGFWSRLGDWFFPDEDRDVYAEGLRRGGFLVSVSVNESNYDTAHDILDDEGSIDLDERADLWREEGWTAGGQQSAASKEDVFQADAAAGSAAGVGRYTRSTQATSPRVRGYDLAEDLPNDVVDDVIPTGHQRDVSEGDRTADDRLSQSQSIDDVRQSQVLPGNR
ncbi:MULTISPECIES: hypothetical protein [unclassified Rhizobium]|uniref:hypothetical protein n=1 Tax=unclassified Rhizobium TaxID=2613769 RepID=UPI001C83A765|nr:MULTISPECIES: hypothetical protein [unclassified Rhizobium]MBX5165447.1 hypothetical protein [Rhizobium sp. NZLR4b]MBX5170327.1 hypothetical protein [Rhizobium sp. NZLR1b]MBX5211947.1 hypothetical protein [Rhizobium sp. NZLR11]